MSDLKYNVFYENPAGRKIKYAMMSMPYESAEKILKQYKDRYCNPDGTGKAYPNGMGFYFPGNPRIEPDNKSPFWDGKSR